MRVAIILPVYKARRWIDEAIESVLAQTYHHWHLTIVDDASPDDTVSRIAKWSGSHPNRISLIQLEQNRRPAGARMEAIRRTGGDAIAFIDQDDRWRPEKLERQVTRLQGKPPVEAVHTDVVRIGPDGMLLPGAADAENARRARIPYAALEPEALREELFLTNTIRLASAAILREPFEAVGGFDTTLFGGEDWEFWVRFSRSYSIAHLAQPLVERRIHSGNTSAVHRRERSIGLLNALAKIEQSQPLPDPLVDERRAGLLRRATISELGVGHHARAREYARSLLGLRPTGLEAYYLLVLSYLGPATGPAVAASRWLKRSVQEF
jgi:glycosyltransferase involved in cell wall biosynthesis